MHRGGGTWDPSTHASKPLMSPKRLYDMMCFESMDNHPKHSNVRKNNLHPKKKHSRTTCFSTCSFCSWYFRSTRSVYTFDYLFVKYACLSDVKVNYLTPDVPLPDVKKTDIFPIKWWPAATYQSLITAFGVASPIQSDPIQSNQTLGMHTFQRTIPLHFGSRRKLGDGPCGLESWENRHTGSTGIPPVRTWCPVELEGDGSFWCVTWCVAFVALIT